MKIARSEKITQNFKDNTVTMTVNGKKCRVNKFEADYLKEKLAAKASKASNKKEK